MKIRVVKKMFSGYWYRTGDEFEVIREDKALFGKTNILIPIYVVRDQGIEKMVLKQDAEIIQEQVVRRG